MITVFKNILKTLFFIPTLCSRVITEVGTSNNQFMVIYPVFLNNFKGIVYYICDINISEMFLSTMATLVF